MLLAHRLAQSWRMASIEKRGKRWRVRILVHGTRESASFGTRQEAAQWALQRAAEASGRALPDKTLADALARYRAEITPSHKGAKWERTRLDAFARHRLARKAVSAVTGPDLAAWRDARLGEVSGATVAREMTLLRSVFEAARRDWGWVRTNPVADVRKPRTPASRKRRISADEIDRLELALGLGDGLAAGTALQRTGLAFLFALETAMRAGEILGMRWQDVAEKTVTLPRTKNGDLRVVPLSPKAREILALLPRTPEPVFQLQAGTRDVLWRKAVQWAGIDDLHFHDSRAEAIWRLSKKLDVMELARVIGHRNVNSLLLYYQTDAAELADRL